MSVTLRRGVTHREMVGADGKSGGGLPDTGFPFREAA